MLIFVEWFVFPSESANSLWLLPSITLWGLHAIRAGPGDVAMTDCLVSNFARLCTWITPMCNFRRSLVCGESTNNNNYITELCYSIWVSSTICISRQVIEVYSSKLPAYIIFCKGAVYHGVNFRNNANLLYFLTWLPSSQRHRVNLTNEKLETWPSISRVKCLFQSIAIAMSPLSSQHKRNTSFTWHSLC